MVISPAYADTGWSGHTPSGQYFNYRTAHPAGVYVSNSYQGQDATIGLSVENFDYTLGGGPNGFDIYHLRLAGAANTRVAHNYIVDNSPPFTGYDTCGAYSTCIDPGIKAGGGKWFNFGGLIYYFWGHPYSSIFVCSNGWAAFQFAGDVNNCPSTPETFPTNDNPSTLPTAIIAPFWEPLNIDPNIGSGTIRFDLGPPLVYNNRYTHGAGSGFGVTWSNVMVSGTDTCRAPCTPHPSQNSFSFSFDNVGDVQFGYGYIDPKDPNYQRATIGLEDPSGFYAQNPSRTDALTYGGVQMRDPNMDIKDVIPNAHITDTKMILSDLTPSDNAIGGWDTNFLKQANFRIGQPVPRNYDLNGYANIAAGAVVGLLCASGVGCVVLGVVVAVSGDVFLKALSQQPPPISFPSNMGGSTPGTFEILAHQDDGLCGVALYASDQNWHDCAADVGVFEQVDWAVPHDGSVHTISVGFSIQLGSAACCPGSSNPWKSTSVTFTVNGGDFSINANPTSISVPLGT